MLQDAQLPFQAYVTLANDLLTIVGILAAFGWFFFRWQHGRRAQMSLGCEFFPGIGPEALVADVQITIENKGLVTQDISGFSIVIRSLGLPQPTFDAAAETLPFQRLVFEAPRLVAVDADVRPGVQRLFSYPILLKDPGSLIQVTVGLRYDPNKEPINPVQRVFRIPSPNGTIEAVPDTALQGTPFFRTSEA